MVANPHKESCDLVEWRDDYILSGREIKLIWSSYDRELSMEVDFAWREYVSFSKLPPKQTWQSFKKTDDIRDIILRFTQMYNAGRQHELPLAAKQQVDAGTSAPGSGNPAPADTPKRPPPSPAAAAIYKKGDKYVCNKSMEKHCTNPKNKICKFYNMGRCTKPTTGTDACPWKHVCSQPNCKESHMAKDHHVVRSPS